jgi:hypothetical protein
MQELSSQFLHEMNYDTGFLPVIRKYPAHFYKKQPGLFFLMGKFIHISLIFFPMAIDFPQKESCPRKTRGNLSHLPDRIFPSPEETFISTFLLPAESPGICLSRHKKERFMD